MGSNPTLSASTRLKNPFLSIVLRPGAGWEAVRAAPPRWHAALLYHVAPLALLPAIAWPIGHALDPIGPQALAPAWFAGSFAMTFGFCIAAVALTAAALHALAPFFGAARHWDRAFAVAAYSSTPVLLAGPLLVSAVLAIVAVVAFFHACALGALGVERVLGCRGEDAAMYVAGAALLSGAGGLALGALCGIAGIL